MWFLFLFVCLFLTVRYSHRFFVYVECFLFAFIVDVILAKSQSQC